MSTSDLLLDSAAVRLRSALGDRIVFEGEPDWDPARTPWNLAVDQQPFAVARPESSRDVVEIVTAVVAAGLRVAPQATGHAAGALAGSSLADVVLVNLSAMRAVTVDAGAAVARVQGGARWSDVIGAAAPHGLTALHGSAADVGVVGYALSGGLSFYARAHGLAVNDVRAVELVGADGVLVRASAQENTDLFWAVRGGSGAFGVVVALEVALRPIPDVFAGMLLWDAAHAPAVAGAWAAWTAAVPETATTTLRIMNFPPMEQLPPFLSGRSVIVMDGAILESDAVASALLEPLRALGPEIDTFSRIPSERLLDVHMDPPGPTPAATAHAILDVLPVEAAERFVDVGRAGGLFITELRHLGGAIARDPLGAGALGAIAGEYMLHTIALVPAPETASAAHGAVWAGIAAFDDWRTDALALTFIDGGVGDRAPAFGAAVERLRETKSQLDRAGVFVAAHPV